MGPKRAGFVGLGNMGAPMAGNILSAGLGLDVFDKAGTIEKAPEGATAANSLSELAECCETLFLSLPDGRASFEVAEHIASHNNHVTNCIIDLSTTGVQASQQCFELLSKAGIDYIDAPVSGGKSGATAGTITIIWAGSRALIESHRPYLEAMSKNIFHVGNVAGQGQSMKLLNNFLSATAMTASSEAILYGLTQGLEMDTMLKVLNVSTGQNTATSDKFPRQIATGNYAAGFHTTLMSKDLNLYAESVHSAGTSKQVIDLLQKTWQQFDQEMPGSDFTRIFQFLQNPD
ncbi:MAG: NAD(P)-dependent oxidoreductase [SAR324 cluster bacterium]|nr:NAD(P)-dependent oxidoreductase [SAR324 cluster bacterium]